MTWDDRQRHPQRSFVPEPLFKARFFAALGFTADRWIDFDAALRAQHLVLDAEAGPVEPYGQFFTIRAMLKGPKGTSAVVSVWLVRTGEDHPRFVTAYPGGAK